VSTLPDNSFKGIYQNRLDLASLPLAGRLKYFLPVWEQITRDPWVLQVVSGYLIEFSHTPIQFQLPNKVPTSLEHQTLIDQEVQELLSKNAVHYVNQTCPEEPGFVSSIFVVPKKGGGHRPVVNLKPLNQFIPYEHFKMESILMLKDLITKGDYMIKIDLKNAYLTVPVGESHQKFLRFRWRDTLLEFSCLPFGLASAPRVFTKLLKPVWSVLRQRGVRLIAYLDDVLVMASTRDLAKQHANFVLTLLESLGFVVNYVKSVLEPSKQIEFLGFHINTETLCISLPRDKVRKIRTVCQKLIDDPNITVRELSKFLGLLSSSIQAVFPAPLHYRYLQQAKNAALKAHQSYEAPICLDNQALLEVTWWRDNLVAWNGRAMIQEPIDLVIETDASLQGWGAHCQGVSTGGRWSPSEATSHINYLELLAGSLAIKSFTKNRVKAQVLLLMDNVTAISYINKMGGTHSQLLSHLSKDLWDWCLEHNILVKAQHIPGVLNTEADRESRVFIDSSDWKLNPSLFQCLLQAWGPLEIDLFASRLTYQLEQYVSWRPDPQALFTDAFSLDWNKYRAYAFPPFALIGRCLQQIRRQKVTYLVLVAPVWTSQPWYPLLLDLCIDFPILLPARNDLLSQGPNNHPLDQLQLAGWLLSTQVSKRQEFLTKLEKSSWQLGEKTPIPPMLLHGTNGVAGVTRESQLIPFHHL